MTTHPRRWLVTGGCLLLVLVAVRLFLVAPVVVSGPSMIPTLHDGEVLLIERWQASDVHRGDVVVFRTPDDATASVKRVLGTEGDRVVIRDAVLNVNDVPVTEPYVDPATIDGLYTPTTVVPEDHVFVLGDNRARSVDSREYGPVAVDKVEGRVLLRLWPPGLP